MMTVIDLARNMREQNNKPLKTPLREMIVVHPDAEFLEDITVKLKELIVFSQSVRLGRQWEMLPREVKAMTQADILAFERPEKLHFSGHCLKFSDIKTPSTLLVNIHTLEGTIVIALAYVKIERASDWFSCEFQRPPSVTKKEMDASEMNPETKKKAGLEPTDVVEEEYIKKLLGSPLLDHSMISPDAGPNIVFDFDRLPNYFKEITNTWKHYARICYPETIPKLKSEFQVGKESGMIDCRHNALLRLILLPVSPDQSRMPAK
ncbi:hypothetical protein HPP92_012311 [Vanilla planifolia]|uniref:Uncharacterized protein n=1 Tax=Vanilla planifolia TaxID=51239 RepID=A0A835R0Q1_VANPL|nr:hypothetical protein HPP92_012311 [Vanilla planifolia]